MAAPHLRICARLFLQASGLVVSQVRTYVRMGKGRCRQYLDLSIRTDVLLWRYRARLRTIGSLRSELRKSAVATLPARCVNVLIAETFNHLVRLRKRSTARRDQPWLRAISVSVTWSFSKSHLDRTCKRLHISAPEFGATTYWRSAFGCLRPGAFDAAKHWFCSDSRAAERSGGDSDIGCRRRRRR